LIKKSIISFSGSDIELLITNIICIGQKLADDPLQDDPLPRASNSIRTCECRSSNYT